MRNSWTGGQYSVFRVLLGGYLFVHFAYLVPWSPELFSSGGMLPEPELSPLSGLFVNILNFVDDPIVVIVLTAAAAIAALFLFAGYADKWAALYLWFVLACLFGRNPLIANPSLPYVGWMLLAHLCIPKAPYGSWQARGRADPSGGWQLPAPLFFAAWVILALSYSYSGYTKLFSPSWVSGDNVAYVLNNPLARDNFLRDLLLWLPPIFLRSLTWGILLVELLFAPIALFRRARPWLWGILLFTQFGFALLLNFPDLTIAMLLFHLLTFDPGWIRMRRGTGLATLFYDGTCALCHAMVRFLLAEDRTGQIQLSPLQGVHVGEVLSKQAQEALPDSIVLVSDDGVELESDAVIGCLDRLGGLWRLLGYILKATPKRVRDWGYQLVGRNRYRIFGRKTELCPIMPAEMRRRFLD